MKPIEMHRRSLSATLKLGRLLRDKKIRDQEVNNRANNNRASNRRAPNDPAMNNPVVKNQIKTTGRITKRRRLTQATQGTPKPIGPPAAKKTNLTRLRNLLATPKATTIQKINAQTHRESKPMTHRHKTLSNHSKTLSNHSKTRKRTGTTKTLNQIPPSQVIQKQIPRQNNLLAKTTDHLRNQQTTNNNRVNRVPPSP